MQLADAHCHLQDERLSADINGVLDRAHASGIGILVCCGSAESDWDGVAALSARKSIVPCYGLHPWYIRERSSVWRDTLVARLSTDPRAAVGEIGLDHAVRERDEGDQMSVFTEQLRIAADLRRPACIHCRKAWGAMLPALASAPLPAGFVIHSYSGSVELIRPLTDLGAFFSFSGTLTWTRNRRAHEAAVAVPADRLLIETDSPDLPPAPEDGAAPALVNEPANLRRVLASLARLRGVAEEEVAQTTWANSVRLFRTPDSCANGR
jgi:TatD DNase family protein